MEENQNAMLMAAAVFRLASAVFYLAMSVATLGVIWLMGLWVAVRRAHPPVKDDSGQWDGI